MIYPSDMKFLFSYILFFVVYSQEYFCLLYCEAEEENSMLQPNNLISHFIIVSIKQWVS